MKIHHRTRILNVPSPLLTEPNFPELFQIKGSLNNKITALQLRVQIVTVIFFLKGFLGMVLAHMQQIGRGELTA